ncbi:MAG: hypothetical protein U0P30_08725 [Vicinamibacterales bacterium]
MPTIPPASSASNRHTSKLLAIAGIVAIGAGLWWTRPTSSPAGATPPDTSAAPGAAPAATLPAVSLRLVPLLPSADVPAVAVPRDTAMVHLRLAGTDMPAAEDLVAEISAVGRDEVKRWPVDDAPRANDDADRMVSVPPYAVPPGDYTLTLWRGDADMLRRYQFRITP